MLNSELKPIHHLILTYLNLKDLIVLKLTCKYFSNLSLINQQIINKISNNFKVIRENLGDQTDEHINYNLLPLFIKKEVIEKYLYFISDLKVTKINNCKYDLKGIYFSLDLYYIFNLNQKEILVRSLCDKIFELSEHANLKNKSVYSYGYRCEKEFELYPIYHNIIYMLQTIFFHEHNNHVKNFIMQEMIDLQYKTNYGLYNNKFKVNDFLHPIHFPLDNLNTFKMIIDNGLFLKKYYSCYVNNYLDFFFKDYFFSIDKYDDHKFYLSKYLCFTNKEYLGDEYCLLFDSLLRDMGYTIQYLKKFIL